MQQYLFFHTGKIIVHTAILSLCLWIFACAPKTQKADLDLNASDTFSITGDTALADKWWISFQDDVIDSLVTQTIDSNFNLRAARERWIASQAVIKREKANLLPDLEASIQSRISRPEPDFVGGENIQFGLYSSYEVDLWGRIKAGVDAARFRSESDLMDYQAAAVSLSAEITQTWFRLLAARQQVNLIRQQIETNERILQLIRSRFSQGQIQSVDLLRQESLLQATIEQKWRLEATQEALAYQLSALTGTFPQSSQSFPVDSLPALPPLPQTGIPARLIERRPDVRRSFLLLQAADRDLAAAISNQYPRLTFNTSGSVRANDLEQLLEGWAYALGANLVAPLFYGGRLKAEVDRNRALKQQRLYQYGQSILTAYREVEEALIREQKQKQALLTLENQAELTNRSYQQLRIAYFNGQGNYLDVLTALDREQQLRRDLIAARRDLLITRIGLYRALAGSFVESNSESN